MARHLVCLVIDVGASADDAIGARRLLDLLDDSGVCASFALAEDVDAALRDRITGERHEIVREDGATRLELDTTSLSVWPAPDAASGALVITSLGRLETQDRGRVRAVVAEWADDVAEATAGTNFAVLAFAIAADAASGAAIKALRGFLDAVHETGATFVTITDAARETRERIGEPPQSMM